MDPTHFLAAPAYRKARTPSEIDAFYDRNGWDAFALPRLLRSLLATRKREGATTGEFVVAHPAE